VVTGTSTPGSEYGLIDGVQDALSVLGLVPFAGDVVDGINALIYLARGQHAEAAMSAAAMVPFGGIVATGLRLSKRLGKLFKAAKTGAGAADDAFSHGMKYADRVRSRGVQDPVSHNFPYSFDDGILATKPIPKNNGYNIFQKPGTMNGNDGVFEIGVTKDGVIDHRFFRPKK
jgi:hypothetical protein